MSDTIYDIEKLLSDFQIDYKDMNSRGWWTITCPFCLSDSSYKLGVREEAKAYCWACGSHSFDSVVKILTNKDWFKIRLAYATDLSPRDLYLMKNSEGLARPEKLELPEGTGKLCDRAKKYLDSRGFIAEELEELYGLKSTGIYGHHNFRIVIPIFFENRLCSYTCRDYTGRVPKELRYLSCEKDKEIYPHKELLYGFDQVPGSHVIAVEGCPDKWRMGVNSVALFGTSYTQDQVNLLASFEKVSILLDGEVEAQYKANKLGGELSGMGVEVENIFLKGMNDPGSMKQSDADQLVKEIMG